MDGCLWMMLDDVPFIVHVINDSLGGACLLSRVFYMVFYGGNGVHLQLVRSRCIPSLFRMPGEAGTGG
jgi:hypothetical protein